MINLLASSEPTHPENEGTLTGGDHARATERHNGTTGALAISCDMEKKSGGKTQYHPCVGGVEQPTHTGLLWSTSPLLASAFFGPSGRPLKLGEEVQQYALRPVGHWGTMSRDAMEEAETLVTKAMAATKEKNDFWKSIVEDVV